MSPAASTRWCPTPEQVMILEEMYRSGVRTPNAAQIQQITAHLSLYGKIEGKNVFYWFQNHKARDRQKLRKKLLGKQLQQHQQQIMFSHHIFPTFDPHHHHQQQFQHYPNHHNNNNNNSLLHHLHFDQPPPPALPLPPPPPCCGPTSSSSLGLFHHQLPSVNPSTYFGAHQTRAEDAVPQMANSCTWKMETTSEAKYARDNKKKPMMRMFTNNDHHDDWMMMMRSRDHHHHDNDDNHDYYYHDDENSSTKPIKTLELFPIKDKTSLKKDLSYV